LALINKDINNDTGSTVTELKTLSSINKHSNNLLDQISLKLDSTVNGSNGCLAAPTCTGDAVRCATLKELWLLRCQDTSTDELTEEVDESVASSITSDLDAHGQSSLDNIFDDVNAIDGSLSGGLVGNETNNAQGIMNSVFPSFSCSSLEMNVLGHGVFSITCADTQILRDLLSWVFYVLTAMFLFNLMLTPINKGD
jgi:hypothetical protein